MTIGSGKRVLRHICKDPAIIGVRRKKRRFINLPRVLCEEKRAVQPRVRRLLPIGVIIKFRRLRIPDPIRRSRTQSHVFMAHLRTSRRDIICRLAESARQISHPLQRIGMKIADHIVRRTCPNRFLRKMQCLGIALRRKRSEDPVFQCRIGSTHSIVIPRTCLYPSRISVRDAYAAHTVSYAVPTAAP